MHLAMAGNIEVPAYLVVVAKGYAIERIPSSNLLRATNGEHSFVAETSVELLALVALVEARGERWPASDAEIDDYLARFPGT